MGEHYKKLQELTDPKVKLSLLQSIALRINKLSFLNRKNRVHESAKIIQELEHQSSVVGNNQFIINKYFVLKKNKEYETAHKYVKGIIEQNLNLGFCLLVDLCQQQGDTSTIINSLKSLPKNDSEHAKNFIFSLLINDESLFSKYSSYLDDLIKTSS